MLLRSVDKTRSNFTNLEKGICSEYQEYIVTNSKIKLGGYIMDEFQALVMAQLEEANQIEEIGVKMDELEKEKQMIEKNGEDASEVIHHMLVLRSQLFIHHFQLEIFTDEVIKVFRQSKSICI